MELATRVERFSNGDFPAVCVRSGLPADRWVPVEAARRATWPWALLPLSAVAWLVAWWRVDRERLWGLLPFAAGHVEGVEATWDLARGVVLLGGVHPDFVEACRRHQHDALPGPTAEP